MASSAVKIRAARLGRGDSEIIEESLRRDLGLDLLERLWAKNERSDDDATALAVEAQHSPRPQRPDAGLPASPLPRTAQ
jgi:hypothetical protein